MPKRAVVFAGQGAQFVGMGRDLAEAYPECRRIYDRADETLGYSLSGICFEGPESELTRSDRCQPAIFVTSAACFAALRREAPGVEFDAAAGLSLGEWTALHVAGALTFEDTLRVLEARGRLMQEACEKRPGGMASIIGLPVEKVAEICRLTGVEISNLNSPEQTVVSGEKEKVKRAAEEAKAAGASRAVELNVAGAFHSALMGSAAAGLAEALSGIAFLETRIPVVSNVTAAPHGAPEDIRRTMVSQVTSSVRWCDSVQWLRRNGVAACVECGPGRVLSGLIKRIDGNMALDNVQDVATLRGTVSELTGSDGG